MDNFEEYSHMLNKEDQDYINKQEFKEKPMEPTYNKVQYSEFTPDRVGQWVLRGDTIEEVLAMKKELFGIAKPLTPADTPQTPVVAPAPQTIEFAAEDTAMCRTHNVKMKFYEKNGRSWWSHSQKDQGGNWVYCSGKGFGVK